MKKIDKHIWAVHQFLTEFETDCFRDSKTHKRCKRKWNSRDNSEFAYYHAEEGHYVIRHEINNCFWFVKAKSPEEAIEKVKDDLAFSWVL